MNFIKKLFLKEPDTIFWKDLTKIEWEAIEVGEVFFSRGCVDVLAKISSTEARKLAEDYEEDFYSNALLTYQSDWLWGGCFENPTNHICVEQLYRVPLHIQQLWRQD